MWIAHVREHTRIDGLTWYHFADRDKNESQKIELF